MHGWWIFCADHKPSPRPSPRGGGRRTRAARRRCGRIGTGATPMQKMTVAEARRADSAGQQVRLQGWIRTRRDSKGGFSFLELSDGSSIGNIQIIAEAGLLNYESEIKHLSAGCSVTVEGELKASPAKGQSTEVQAH